MQIIIANILEFLSEISIENLLENRKKTTLISINAIRK